MSIEHPWSVLLRNQNQSLKDSSFSSTVVLYLCRVLLSPISLLRPMLLVLIICLPVWVNAGPLCLDSSAVMEELILKKVVDLQSEIRKLNSRRDSLRAEIRKIYANTKPASDVRKLEESLDQQFESAEYNLWEWMCLLSEARRLSFVPESARAELEKRIRDRFKLLALKKNPDKNKKIDDQDRRMDLGRFPVMEQDVCSLVYFDGGKIASTGFTYLSGHTDPLIEGQILDRDFAVCSARIFYSGSKCYADWKIEFASQKASSVYGLLDATVPFKLEFIDGSYIYLFPSVSTLGEPDPARNICVYQIQTSLDRSKLKMLKKKELYSITFLWEKGKEKFEIYHISAVKNLLSCLDKKN